MPVNFDKKEFIYPHAFGDGLKMLEFGCSGNGTLTGLTILLANSHNRGGGDLHADQDEIMGRWAGDRIAILGDYSEFEDFAGHKISEEEFVETMEHGVWDERGKGEWRDISEDVLLTMMKDHYVRQDVITMLADGYTGVQEEFVDNNGLREEVDKRKAELKADRDAEQARRNPVSMRPDMAITDKGVETN